jgi:hypothetical protein
MSCYQWEPNHDEENGWTVRKLVNNCVPKEYDETFETEDEAQEIADALNKAPSEGLKRAMRLDVKEGSSDYFARIYMSEWGV